MFDWAVYLISLWLTAAYGHRALRHANVLESTAELSPSYDFIVVGGGTSGLTVADRLTENPETTVLVVESGPLDEQDPSVLVPGLLNLTASPYFFNLTSSPQHQLNNGTFQVPAARVVGGGTVINGMFFDRGSRQDYDSWEALGNPSWGWEGLLPYFEKSENFTPPSQEFADEWDVRWNYSVHGNQGPVQSSFPGFQFSAVKNFFQAWHSLGILTPNDQATGRKTGVLWAPSSLDPDTKTRSYARTAHYDKVSAERPNFHLISNSPVQRVLFENEEAKGVEYLGRTSSQISMVKANKEVILAAGVHSPQILHLSGVGPSEILRSLGLEQVVDLPGVGSNFQDHPTFFMILNFQNPLEPNADTLTSNQTYAAEQLAMYWEKRQDHAEFDVIIQKASQVPANADDSSVLQGRSHQKSLILEAYKSIDSPVQETGFSSSAVMPITLLKPLSRGSIKTLSLSISDPPLVDFGALTEPTDLDILVAALRINRLFLNTSPMRALRTKELSPGANITADEDLRVALRDVIIPSYSHPCCACPMMPRELGGVVSPALLVYGAPRLSVVDASIMPMIPASHTSATVYAIAEKAADIIKERHGV